MLLALVELSSFLWQELENDAQRRRLWLSFNLIVLARHLLKREFA